VPLVQGEDPDAALVPNTSAPQVNLDDNTSGGPSFTERRSETWAARTSDAVAQRELREFDKLMEQLRQGADPLLVERARDVVAAAQPVAKGE